MDFLPDILASSLATGSFLALLLAYAGGVITSATPCIYPMIPITIGVLGTSSTQGDKARQGTLNCFINALVYALGLSFLYAFLGVIAALTGQMFGEISTHPLSYFLVANLCFIFSAWMVGWLKLGSIDFYSKAASSTFLQRINVDRLFTGRIKLFIIGAASGLVAGPCTAPVLASLLTYVATTGNLIYGGVLLFVFSFGLSTLLIIVGTFSSFLTLLPRSGKWMEGGKLIMAVAMFGAGEYFLVQMGMLLF